jgi:hypothetical protein
MIKELTNHEGANQMKFTKAQMKKAEFFIERAKRNPHCENCGSLNPNSEEGYTTCCNECVCFGPGRQGYNRSRFGTEQNYKVACCWAVADAKFMAAGQEVPEGSSQLFN